jgi:hypothetical protein
MLDMVKAINFFTYVFCLDNLKLRLSFQIMLND